MLVERIRHLLIVFLLLPLGALFVSAVLSGTVSIDAPQNGSFLNNNEDINISFLGNANVTIEYNNTGGFVPLNFSENETDGYSFVWITTNGSFAEGTYGLRVTATNSTNASDSATLFAANLTIDNTPPNFTIVLPSTDYNLTDGNSFIVNISVSDGLANITDDTSCSPMIDNDMVSFTGEVKYYVSTETCNGTITLNNPAGLTQGTHTFSINVSDKAGNWNTTSRTFTFDNVTPSVTNIVFSDRTPPNNTVNVTINVTVSDPIGIGLVQISNGSTIIVTNYTGNNTDRVYSIEINLSFFGCQNEELCDLTFLVDDEPGNRNDSETTLGTFDVPSQKYIDPLYADSDPPSILSNSSVNATGIPGQPMLLSVLWSDVSLNDLGTPTVSTLRNQTSQNTTTLTAYDGNQAFTAFFSTTNYTNLSIQHNGTDEGYISYLNVTLNDANDKNTTAAFMFTTQNVSPTIQITNVLNNSVLSSTSFILFEIIEVGVGLNTSTIAVNVTDSVSKVITFAGNASLFNCSCVECNATQSSPNTNYIANYTCQLSLDWVSGPTTFVFDVSDFYNNTNSTMYNFSIAQPPDIVNITINGASIASTTPLTSIAVSFSNASRETQFNWTVQVTAPINETAIAFVNVSDTQSQIFTSVPAGKLYNVTAGKNYLAINLTLDNSPIVDTVQLNLTANVPLNLSQLSDQYAGGLIDAWSVIENGADVSQERFVNSTFDILVNTSNDTAQQSFTALFNYTGLSGLSLRWNASQNAFQLQMAENATVANLTTVTQSNVTFALEHTGETAVFFDEQQYLLSTTLNVSMTNRTVYYQENAAAVYFLQLCSAAPSSAIQENEACYINTTNTTTLYLPRFEEKDRIIIGELDNRGPNVTIVTSPNVSQSILTVQLSVVTPNPNTTFCMFNLSLFNATSNTTTDVSIPYLFASQFTLVGGAWAYAQNFTGSDDGLYNLSVNCADTQNELGAATLNINVTDTTTPLIYNAQDSDIGRDEATITGNADELVLFTVVYGTEADSLTSSQGQAGYSQSADIDLSELSPDTVYYYNLTGCDKKGRCGTSTTGDFRTVAPSAGSGGSGGGGGDPGEITGVGAEATEIRIWGRIDPGETIEYSPREMVISSVQLKFKNSSENVEIGLHQYGEKPDPVDAVGQEAYKYFKIDHKGLDNKVESYFLEFTVAKDWLTEFQVLLETLRMYRLEDGSWVPYEVIRTADHKDSYTYTVALPGFSWFAIAADSELAAVDEVPQNETAPAQDPVQEQPANVPVDTEEKGFVSALDKTESGKLHPVFMIIGVVILIGLFAVGGLKYYQVYKDKEVEHKQQIQKEQIAYDAKKHGRVIHPIERPPQHDPVAGLHAYISKMRQHGYHEDHIRKRLLHAGWDSFIVDQELERR